ncbi:hypothetical protein J437_LFUL000638 [Ladona fulva]|uniref:Uncharacterized protein n=1 Tax=Ladona fulva TaxID=123851 RepID=A0A8K0K1H0_LADFU|nr:hypothetical protein J437_LFUL000638 [Ladona fulva]
MPRAYQRPLAREKMSPVVGNTVREFDRGGRRHQRLGREDEHSLAREKSLEIRRGKRVGVSRFCGSAIHRGAKARSVHDLFVRRSEAESDYISIVWLSRIKGRHFRLVHNPESISLLSLFR